MSFYHWQQDDLILYVKTQPGASKDGFGEIICNENQADQIKIRITALPLDGKANKHLIGYLGKLFKVAKSQVTLLNGETSRNKKLQIHAPAQLPDAIKAEKY
ncbi:MAG: DUF167 family protein [Gammaproteobacteria bacterium]|nr:DUF167 family protein [Gammaproteobacteria bacterium]